MTKEEAYRYIDNLKWLKGYDNTTIDGKTVGEILDEIKTLLKEQEPVVPYVGAEGITINCGNCGETVGYYPAGSSVPDKKCVYCPECGREIKWDG